MITESDWTEGLSTGRAGKGVRLTNRYLVYSTSSKAGTNRVAV